MKPARLQVARVEIHQLHPDAVVSKSKRCARLRDGGERHALGFLFTALHDDLAALHGDAITLVVADEPSAGREEEAAPIISIAAVSAPAKAEVKSGPVGTAPLATIRVEFDRVDRLINLVGELVINQAMLSQRVAESNISNSSPIAVGLEELEQLTREIQEGVMGISAQPVKPLFQRMARIVREVAEATGKEVRFKTEGDATEVDKTVVERLADPLTHMIRNAVDHGLETPEARIAAG